jgi:fatty acid amide hydrolase
MTRTPPAPDETTELGAAELARRIAAGALSSREVVEAHVRRIEEVNPRLNAIVVRRFEEALREAERADARRARGEAVGPLGGVPFTVKESFDVQGLPTTMGLSARTRHAAADDAPTVARLRAAGAVLLGKTNVPQLVMLNEADNPVYGRTNNPWDAARATGGSSGGCAAAVASGCTPLSLGSDIGGSVRLPAHACGVHSLKPTSGRLTMRGHGVIFKGQEAVIAQPGPLARRVEDLRLALEILTATGEETFDPRCPPVPLRDAADVSVERLRVGFYTDNGVMRPGPAIRRAVEEAARALEARGATVEEWTPPGVEVAWGIYHGLMFGDGTAGMRRDLRGSRRDPRIRQLVMTGLVPRALLRVGALELSLAGQRHWAWAARHLGRRSAEEYWALVARRDDYRARFLDALDARGFDAVLCPVEALPAYTHGTSVYLSDSLSHTALYNLLGLPAGVVAATRIGEGEESDRRPGIDLAERLARKVERGSAGLPVGVQVAARHWREDTVLAVMTALEEHFSTRPDYPIQSER